jgi:Transposase DDE domain
MAGFDLALTRVRDQAAQLLVPDRINQLARVKDHTFRNTILTPGNTLCWFVRQIAHGNVACTSVHRLAGEKFSDAAWCQARQRLPMELIQRVHRNLIDQARRDLDERDDLGDDLYRWRGHRLRVVDGTSDSMPDTPTLRQHYGVSGRCREQLGFPTSHLMLLLDHRSGLLIDCIDSRINTNDASVVPQTHRHLQAGDVLLGDVAFSGYAHLALLLQANLHAILPTHQRRIVDFQSDRAFAHPRKGKSSNRIGKPRSRVIRALGDEDQLVEYFKPKQMPRWMDGQQWEQLPDSITVREIRRQVKRDGFRPITVTIVTTLLDPEQYPADELVELRLTRWMVETNIRHLKITLGMQRLKCKTPERVQKERLIFLLVYNLIRIVMLNAARRQRVNVNRISFADALSWLRYGDVSLPPELKINPQRRCRLEPRALKHSQNRYPYMKLPRHVLKSQLRARNCDTT